jgi:hypothetical protein
MCKYECVRRASKRLNFREVADEDDWNIYWTDTSVGIERVAQMKKWQVRINILIFIYLKISISIENKPFSRYE